VHGVQQDVSGAAQYTPTTIILRWEGGVEPVTIDRVGQPEHGVLAGMGPDTSTRPTRATSAWTAFTFRVLDANGQASTGVIRLTVPTALGEQGRPVAGGLWFVVKAAGGIAPAALVLTIKQQPLTQNRLHHNRSRLRPHLVQVGRLQFDFPFSSPA
jgi:hypothetical protein